LKSKPILVTSRSPYFNCFQQFARPRLHLLAFDDLARSPFDHPQLCRRVIENPCAGSTAQAIARRTPAGPVRARRGSGQTPLHARTGPPPHRKWSFVASPRWPYAKTLCPREFGESGARATCLLVKNVLGGLSAPCPGGQSSRHGRVQHPGRYSAGSQTEPSRGKPQMPRTAARGSAAARPLV